MTSTTTLVPRPQIEVGAKKARLFGKGSFFRAVGKCFAKFGVAWSKYGVCVVPTR
jgi:hypothetical protein